MFAYPLRFDNHTDRYDISVTIANLLVLTFDNSPYDIDEYASPCQMKAFAT